MFWVIPEKQSFVVYFALSNDIQKSLVCCHGLPQRIMAAVQLVFLRRPYFTGDLVQLGGDTSTMPLTVSRVNLLETTLIRLDTGGEVIIENAKMLEYVMRSVVVFRLPQPRRVLRPQHTMHRLATRLIPCWGRPFSLDNLTRRPCPARPCDTFAAPFRRLPLPDQRNARNALRLRL